MVFLPFSKICRQRNSYLPFNKIVRFLHATHSGNSIEQCNKTVTAQSRHSENLEVVIRERRLRGKKEKLLDLADDRIHSQTRSRSQAASV